MSSGLQRRRGGKSFTPTTNGDSSNDYDTEENVGSHKIAYDPEDMATANKEKEVPLLTLMEEVLLVGLKDKEGYLSFWNDNISYALRGLIIMELALRGKIRMVNDPVRRRFELADRLIEVVDGSITGETLLDEALKLIKSDTSNLSVSNWIDLLSGETWNLMKINYQLKQVRERLAKGLVDKGVLKTERKNFFLFDMATHPISDPSAKKGVVSRIRNLLVNRNYIIEYDDKFFPPQISSKYLRAIALVCGCYAANVLENVLTELSYENRDKAFARADELLNDYSEYPFETKTSSLGVGLNLQSEVAKEIETEGTSELVLEVFAAVISVFSKMDSII
ncbi:unnamed protein product [Kuraishia capsulata CBS 1993]|uniref:Vacuolar protein sorting-associated protein 74 n=1 Tax=Kuraishia capsulata CBS 1993 TaxID=1382522 RepID=W6MUP9_9ASCO|nr:uncharacterized protein KUCA_T00005455001 [Kuraishia capsulata CBS 1993]CDK29467.1 unnamed protein product [Kuraishia capsulata CBS 1993]